MSIVVPHGWRIVVNSKESFLLIPRQKSGVPTTAHLSVYRTQETDRKEFEKPKTRFLEASPDFQSPLEQFEWLAERTESQHDVQITTWRGSAWVDGEIVHLSYSFFGEESTPDKLPEMVGRYIETLRIDNGTKADPEP